MSLNLTKMLRLGAEEACWAHNPEVIGSKPIVITKNKNALNYILLHFCFYHLSN